jgi:hypothetical protein
MTTAKSNFDLQQHLAANREIALIWEIADVQQVRPDLSDDQCWEVLQQVFHEHDADLGVSWTTLLCKADELFGHAGQTEPPANTSN